MEEELKKFRELDCFPLFVERSCTLSNLGIKTKITDCFIDFGRDAEGAARLLYEIIEKVYCVNTDGELECEVNVGDDNIQKSRNYHVSRRPYLNKKEDIKKNKIIVIGNAILFPANLVVGILFLAEDNMFGLFNLFFGLLSLIWLFVLRHSIMHLFRGVNDKKG